MTSRWASVGAFAAACLVLAGCAGAGSAPTTDEPTPSTTSISNSEFDLWRSGSSQDAQVETSAGTVLMGGGTDVDAAFRWMLDKAGGGE